MSNTAADQWYELHVRDADLLGFPKHLPRIEGPLTKAELLLRVQQIIDCLPNDDGVVAHSALGIRVNPSDAGGLMNTCEYEVGTDLNRVTAASSAAPPIQPAANSVEPHTGEMVAAPIVGFRTWAMNIPSILVGGNLMDGEPQLFGPNWYGRSARYEWPDAELVARCREKSHHAPDPGCECGVYAKHARIDDYGVANVPKGCHVHGAVLGLGDVLVYEEGWRAECARIIAFAHEGVDQRYMPALQRLARKFDVPVLSWGELYDHACSRGKRQRIVRRAGEEPAIEEVT